MRRNKVIEALENEQLKSEIPEFGPGDTVVVQVKVREGNRERLQACQWQLFPQTHLQIFLIK